MSNATEKTTLVFEDRLGDLLHEKKISQRKLAKESGVSESVISKYKNGGIINAGAENLKKLADYFGVSVDYLLCKSNERQTNIEQDLTPKEPPIDVELSIISIFESAIDKYHITDFIDYHFEDVPISFERVEEIQGFIYELQNMLPNYRKDNVETHKLIIDFVLLLREYLSYLSKQMGVKDGRDEKLFFRLPNIDLCEVLKKVTKYRARLNETYGLISGGGTLSVGR